MTRAWLAFLVEPVAGDVALFNKLLHNALFALGAAILLAVAAWRTRPAKIGA